MGANLVMILHACRSTGYVVLTFLDGASILLFLEAFLIHHQPGYPFGWHRSTDVALFAWTLTGFILYQDIHSDDIRDVIYSPKVRDIPSFSPHISNLRPSTLNLIFPNPKP